MAPVNAIGVLVCLFLRRQVTKGSSLIHSCCLFLFGVREQFSSTVNQQTRNVLIGGKNAHLCISAGWLFAQTLHFLKKKSSHVSWIEFSIIKL